MSGPVRSKLPGTMPRAAAPGFHILFRSVANAIQAVGTERMVQFGFRCFMGRLDQACCHSELFKRPPAVVRIQSKTVPFPGASACTPRGHCACSAPCQATTGRNAGLAHCCGWSCRFAALLLQVHICDRNQCFGAGLERCFEWICCPGGNLCCKCTFVAVISVLVPGLRAASGCQVVPVAPFVASAH